MNPLKDSDYSKPLPPNAGLDAILTEFLDKEIGIPPGATELSPDLDMKLSQTLKEIGLLPGSSFPGESSVLADEMVIETNYPDMADTAEISQLKSQPVEPSAPQIHSEQHPFDSSCFDPVRELEKTIQAVATSRETERTSRSGLYVTAAAVLVILAGISTYFFWRKEPQTHSSGTVTASLPQTGSPALESALPKTTAPQMPQGDPTWPASKTSEPAAPVNEARQTQSQETATDIDSGLTIRQETGMANNAGSAGKATQRIRGAGSMNASIRPPESAPVLPIENGLPMVPTPDSAFALQIKDIPLPHSTLPSVSPAVPLPPVRTLSPEGPGVLTVDMAVQRVNPTFPEIAKRMKATGNVEVEFWTDVQGKVVRAHATAGPPILRPAAQEAMMKWRFKPVMAANGGIPGHGKVVFVFRSRD